MSQETYTFACPVCAVRLSVPKALAGVRGPCPQCHHEITAPEPAPAQAPAMAGVGGGGVPPLPPPPVAVAPPAMPADPVRVPPPTRAAAPAIIPAPRPEPPPAEPSLAERPAVELPVSELPVAPPVRPAAPPASGPLLSGPPPLPLESMEDPAAPAPMAANPAALPAVLPAVVPPLAEAPAADRIPDEETSEGEGPAATGLERPAPPPRARRSPLGLAVAALLVVGLLAAAALNFLPRHSLRQWLGRVLPAQAVDAVVGPETAGSRASEAIVAIPTPDSVPSVTVESAEVPAIQVRPALDPAEAPPAPAEVPAPELKVDLADPTDPTDPTDPSAAIGGAPEAADAGGAEVAPAVPPAASTPVPSALGGQDSGVPPSLLPDISQGVSAAPAVVDESLAGAQEALTLFLQARNWQDRLALCEGGDALRGEMESYYRKAKDGPNAPTSVEHIASAPLPDGTRTVQVFHVTFPDLPQGFPVPVRQTEEGWKIDWRAFVEFREGRLKKFLAGYQDGPEVFRVRLQRAHQTDRAVPNADKKYAFRIAAPIDGHEGYVYVDKDDSIVGPKIAKKLDANTIHLVMAKLKWVRGTNGRAHVELRDIVSESWREAP